MNFKKNLEKIDDSRILMENMPGLDLFEEETFGYNLGQLEKIKKIKNICFDLEKAVKSACYQKIDYKKFIVDGINKLEPVYFHISGGDKNSTLDEHKDLRESNFDWKWIKTELLNIAKIRDIFLVFETPKKKNNLENDMVNMEYFRKIN